MALNWNSLPLDLINPYSNTPPKYLLYKLVAKRVRDLVASAQLPGVERIPNCDF